MIKDNKYDIIFLDHMMPDMDGIETYKHMKEFETAVLTVGDGVTISTKLTE